MSAIDRRPLFPVKEEARRHIAALAGSPDASVTFQTFAEGGDSTLGPQVLHGAVDECWDQLVDANNAGHGIFVTVNQTDGEGRKKNNIVRLNALFIDDDGKGGKPIVFNGEPNETFPVVTPSLTVQSKGGQHNYFGLRAGESVKRFTLAQQRLAAHFGTDPKVSDPGRVMRLAGFYHLKDRNSPFLVTVVQDNPARYSIVGVLEAYPPPADLLPGLSPAITRLLAVG